MKYLIVSLHDFHAGSREEISEQIDFLSELGVKNYSILVVPRFHKAPIISEDEASMAFLKERYEMGDDLVLHGFFHHSIDNRAASLFWNRIYTNCESEFLDLSPGEMKHRIELGQGIWHENDWKLSGFIAPAWLMPKKRESVLKKLGFVYTNYLRSISLIQKRKRVKAQSLCYSTRASWRRTVSLSWNQALFDRLRHRDLIRLSLHPNDLKFSEIKQQIG
ncbi:MAG: polysaccharide deacetylase family protein, partial [Verrucomicrobiota bacterium]